MLLRKFKLFQKARTEGVLLCRSLKVRFDILQTGHSPSCQRIAYPLQIITRDFEAETVIIKGTTLS